MTGRREAGAGGIVDTTREFVANELFPHEAEVEATGRLRPELRDEIIGRLEALEARLGRAPTDDEVETPEDYRERFAPAAARDLEMICANPDRVVQRGDRIIYCGGSLADLYESMGGRVTMAGKPYGPIYALALTEAEQLLGRPVDRSRVLCIGDGVVTDVMGANQQGLDCLFIAQGIHGDAARGDDGKLDPAKAADLLKAETTYARYAALDLVW